MGAPAGVGVSPASSTIVLRPASGSLSLKIRHQRSRGTAAEVVVKGEYNSGESVPTTDVARRHRMWARGAGWSSRPGALEAGEEWDGYADAANACTRFGYICPSGEQTAFTPVVGWGAPQKLISFNGDLFGIFDNVIAYKASGSATWVDLHTRSGTDQFTDAEVWEGRLRVALLCNHTGSGMHPFVSIIPSGGAYTVLNPTPALPVGTMTTTATPQCRLLQTAFWEFEGRSGYRLISQVTDHQYRYMISPTGDPYDALNWGPQTRLGESTYDIRRMTSSHDTCWFIKRDGIYAVTDKNASAGGENMTPYWDDQLDDSDIRINSFYWNQFLIASHAFGADMIDVNSYTVKDRPRQIGVGHGRPNNTNLSGFYTAFASDSGWLVAGIRGANGRSYVLYGTARQRESPSAGVTDIDWFAEAGPFPVGLDINCLTVYTEGATGRPYLWVGLQDQAGNPYLIAVEGFIGTSPLVDAGHKYNTTAEVTFTDEHWAARAATKGALRGELGVRNCGSGRSVAFYAVAGSGTPFGAPAHVVAGDVETETFDLTAVRGSVIRTKAVLTSTPTVPVVIEEMGLKANLGFKLRSTGTWLVELGDETEGDLPSFDTPSRTEAALVALAESVEAFDVLDDEGTSISVVLLNVLPWQREDSPVNDLGVHQKTRLLEVGYQVVGQPEPTPYGDF